MTFKKMERTMPEKIKAGKTRILFDGSPSSCYKVSGLNGDMILVEKIGGIATGNEYLVLSPQEIKERYTIFDHESEIEI